MRVGMGDNTVRLWNVANGQPIAILTGARPPGLMRSPIRLTAPQSQVGGGYGDDTVRLWDANTGRLKATLVGTHGLD